MTTEYTPNDYSGRGAFSGSVKLADINTTELTDASPTCTITLPDVARVKDLLIDVVTDKGCTVDVARYADQSLTHALKPATQQTIADGGDSESYVVNDLGCAAAVVTITKTEAGTSSGFIASVRGEG